MSFIIMCNYATVIYILQLGCHYIILQVLVWKWHFDTGQILGFQPWRELVYEKVFTWKGPDFCLVFLNIFWQPRPTELNKRENRESAVPACSLE